MATDYDESAVIERYIWDHYHALIPDHVKLAGKALQHELKAATAGNSGVGVKLQEKTRLARADPAVRELFHKYGNSFLLSIALKVLEDHPDEVNLNRCPKCDRVPRTPRATQCPWCFHSWR